MDNKKPYKFGNSESITVDDLGLKNKIIDFIFSSFK